jgi:hypothetical protein
MESELGTSKIQKKKKKEENDTRIHKIETNLRKPKETKIDKTQDKFDQKNDTW